jgi:hypothetical protein
MSFKYIIVNLSLGCSAVVECVLGMHETLRKKKERNRKWEGMKETPNLSLI